MDKEKYIKKVLSSGDNFKSIEVSDYVWTRIHGQLTTVEDKISMGKVWMLAIGLSVLFVINFATILQPNSTNSNTNSELFESPVSDFYN